MGNSAGIGMKHYAELVDAKAAREYWSIKPIRSTDRKIVADLLKHARGHRNSRSVDFTRREKLFS
jgi:hypothetical protein